MTKAQFNSKVDDVINLVKHYPNITIPAAVEKVCGEPINKENSELQFSLQDAVEKELHPEWWIKQ